MKWPLKFFILFLLQLSVCEFEASNNVIVSTKLGFVKGSLMRTRMGKTIYAFRGIYYADSPTGQLRFKPPVPVKPWSGVFDASEEGPSCIQGKGVKMTENCLTLNIYTKQIPGSNDQSQRKQPVIVFIFPGKFSLGTPQSFMFGPKYLLDHDVVLVTINYRLATLGFINTGDQYAPGNLGLKDQVAALRFVQDHIEAFGGDPSSVTLTGQSAGSRSIVLHLLSPMSKGLFHKAIGMSGTMTTPIPPLREQVDLAVKQANLLNCSVESREEMFKCLLEKPAEDFGRTIAAFNEYEDNPTTIWYPAVEPEIPGVERFLSLEPEDLMKLGLIHDIPIIYGTTQDEYSYKVSGPVERALKGNHSFFQDFTDRWEELAPMCFQYERDTNRSKYVSRELAKFYFNNEPITVNNADILRRLLADSLAHFPIYRTANLLSKFSRAPVYLYKFTYQGRYSVAVWSDSKKPSAGVSHGDDLQYIFNIDNDIFHPLSTFPLFTEEDPELVIVKQLTAIWAHFAKTGQPLPKNRELFGNLIWNKYTPEDGRFLNIGQSLTIDTDFFSEDMKFWDTLFP